MTLANCITNHDLNTDQRMKQLLQRQLEKHFGDALHNGMEPFLGAIDGTYNDYDNLHLPTTAR